MKKIDKNYIEDLIEPYLEKINTICEIVGKPNNITENIFIVSKGDIEYEDLIQNQCRGKCEPKNGYIYFRNDTELNPLIIIHEFIHRLSRKRLWFEWVIGTQYKDGKTTYFNEFLTEAITYKITGQKENNNKYNVGIKYIEKLFNRLIIRFYFFYIIILCYEIIIGLTKDTFGTILIIKLKKIKSNIVFSTAIHLIRVSLKSGSRW